MLEPKQTNNNLNEEAGATVASAGSSLSSGSSLLNATTHNNNNNNNSETIRLPWGAYKERQSYFLNHVMSNQTPVDLSANLPQADSSSNQDKKKPGEYVMQLVMLNFIQLTSKKFDQLISNEKKEKRLKECFQKSDDLQVDQLVQTLGNVAEQCLPSLVRFLLKWYDAQLLNLNFLKQQHMQQQMMQQNESTSQSAASSSSSSSSTATSASSKLPNNKTRQLQIIQAKQERDYLDERKELIINSILCIFLIEILKQLPFHPGNEDLLNSIIDLSFKRFLKKDIITSINYYSQLSADNQYVTDLYAEVIGTLAQSRFSLVKRRFLVEFERINVPSSQSPSSTSTTSLSSSTQQLASADSQSNLINSSSNTSLLTQTQSSTGESLVLSQTSSTSANIIKLLNGMKYFRIKMVPIEDFEASFQFLNECAQHFVETKDKDIKYTLAALFVDILVPITGSVKNEVNIPCLKQFVDVLYPHAFELAAKTKHRFSSFPLITCLLCVSQRQFFLNNWFQFSQICMQQFKSREASLNRLALEAIVRLIWVYMIRIKGEKPHETNQRLQTIIQNIFPKNNKLVNPKDMPISLFIKIIQFIAYEKLDFAMKEIIYELLSIDVSQVNNTTNNDLNNSLNNNDLEHLLAGANEQNNSASEINNSANSASQANDSANSNVNTTQINPSNPLQSSNSSLMSSMAFRSSKENIILMPQRMEIGLRSFCLIADLLQQQKETNQSQAPHMPSTPFNSPDSLQVSLYLQQALNQLNSLNRSRSNTLTQLSQSRLMLSDQLAREIGLAPYYEHVRRAFQDILKTLDASIGRPFLLTRPENASNQFLDNTNGDTLENSSNSINLDSNNETSQSNANDSSSQTFYIDQDSDNSMTNNNNTNQDSQLMMNAENRQRLCLMRTCVSLLPRLMPLFKESELVDMLTRLLIHIDDELKSVSFQTLKLLVNDYPQWRKFILTGFTSFILKEITDLFPKLIEQALKMLIQLLTVWRTSKTQGNLDDYCQIILHLEGFALFNLCHTHVQRRRYALAMLKELKQIGDASKCFRAYEYHSYCLDVLDLASVNAIKQLHLQCFSNDEAQIKGIDNKTKTSAQIKPDLSYLIEQSVSWDTNNNSTPIFISNTVDQLTTYSSTLNLSNKSRSTSLLTNPPPVIPLEEGIDSPPKETDSLNKPNLSTSSNVFSFDPWTECLAIFFSYDFIFTKCPQARADAWPFIFTRLQQLLTYVDPNETHEMPRTSILFGSGANSLEKIRKATTERDANVNLWKNYLVAACCLTSGSDRYLYQSDYEKVLTKSDESTSGGGDSTTSQTSNLLDFTQQTESSMSKFYLNNSVSFGTASSLLKMVVPLIKCDCNSFRENIIRGLGRINIEAIRDLVDELNQAYIKEILAEQKRGDKTRRQFKKKDLIRLTIVRIFQLLADQRTLSRRLIDATRKVPVQYHFYQKQQLEDQKQLRQIFSDFIESCQIYLEQDANLDKQQIDLLTQTRLHFCILIHKLIDSVSEKGKRVQVLTASLRTNIFTMCDKWSGRFSTLQLANSSSSSASSLKLTQPTPQTPPLNSLKQTAHPSHLYIHQAHYQHHNCFHFYEELELAATHACASLICCDDTLNMLIQSNKLVFPWLNQLLDHANIEMKMFDYCKCTLPNEIFMLSLNVCNKLLETSTLSSSINLNNTKCSIFEWIIHKCFTTSQEISDLCFISLSRVYIQSASTEKQPVKTNPTSSSNNDKHMNKTFPMHQLLDSHCFGALFALVLINLGSSRLNIHEQAVKMLRVLYRNHFKQLTESKPSSTLSNESLHDASFDLINSTAVYSKSKLFISEYFALNAPEHSLSIFCELTSRFEHASHQIRKDILHVLVPWLYNIELIELTNEKANTSPTEIVLNNLFYLTCKFADLYSNEFELVWAVLGAAYTLNLRIILRYLFIMVTMATYEIVNTAKRVSSYLSKTSPDRVIDELVNEMEQMDSLSGVLTRCEKLPFFKFSQVLNESTSEESSSANNSDSDYDEDSSESDNTDSELFNPIVNNSKTSNDTSSDDSGSDDSLNHLDNDDSEDSDCSLSKKKKFKYRINSSKTQQTSVNQIISRKSLNSINIPFNLQTYVCPLNVLLYHIGHNHAHLNQSSTIYSYQKNYLHHNHYEHVTNLSRSNISLMLLTDLFGQDAVDSNYWCLYMPCLFHYCLISFDSSKQLVGEHAKKLFLNLLNVLTIQTGLNHLTEQLNESLHSIIDTQSIVFDRKYTNNSLIEPIRRSNHSQTCHYNFNYRNNSRIQFEKFKSSTSQQYLTPGMHRVLTNMSSAPASPTHQSDRLMNSQQQQQQQQQQKTDELTQTARHYLDYLLRVLVKSKNSPVWSNELLTSQNYSRKLLSVSLINDFVSALQSFLQTICVGKQHQRLTDKWSQYALRTALNTADQHYAARSLQIYRALQIRFTSTSTMLGIMRKLKETCSDEANQGYVVELLLTLKMNACLLASDYNQSHQTTTTTTSNSTKQKSKSLNTKQIKHDKLNKKKKSATAIAKLTSNEIKSKTSTLPRKKYLKRLSQYNHLYETSLTLNLFESKWKLLKERIQTMSTRSLSKYHLYFDHLAKRSHQQTLQLLVQIFWTAICLLESDYDHEFVLAIEIINEILNKIDLNTGVMGQLLVHKHEFRTSLEMFTFRINWPNYPGVQNLLLKGCTCPSSAHTIESTQRLLVKLIPHCFKLNFIDPHNGEKDYGLRGLAMNLMALLPTMILNYEKPNELCNEAAQQYLKVLREQCQLIESQTRPLVAQSQHQYQSSKIEHLKNLSHVMNLYLLGTFGKDKTQWTKCVITYLYEFFHQCQSDQSNQTSSSLFYFDWIIFLTELLDKNISNIQYQQCVFTCLSSLLNLISFNDTHSWSFINEELMRIIVKYMNTMLWNEALDLIRLTVSKSSSLILKSNKFFIGQSAVSSASSSNQPTEVQFSSKKELPGRTLEFEFDFNSFVPATTAKLPLNLLSFHAMRQQTLDQQQQQQQQTNSWKRPLLSQAKTRDKFQLLLQALDKNQSFSQQTEPIEQKSQVNLAFSNPVPTIQTEDLTKTSPTKLVSILNTSTSSLSKKSGSTSSLNTSISSSLNKLPTTNSPKQKNAPIVPIITNDFNKSHLKKSHHRTASTATTLQINGQTVSTSMTSLLMSATTASTNTLTDADLKNRLNLDDNNFINNTFSFLDDLDKNEPVLVDTNDEIVEKQVLSSKFDSLIEPAGDEDLLLKPRAKTISESSAKLDTISISSKTKPIAPKINKVSASIGVASGAEALKAINNLSSNHNSANRKLLHEIKQQQLLQQQQQLTPEKRKSITRIIRSDSFQNNNNNNNNSNNNNSLPSPSSTNQSNPNQSNVIYDHRTSPPKTIQLTTANTPAKSVETILQLKRNELRVSSSGSLSSLLAFDDSKSTEKLVDSNQSSLRSMTLPGKNSSSTHHHHQVRSPVHDVNFQIPNKKILSWIHQVNRKNLEEKWTKHLSQPNENKSLTQTFYLFKFVFKELKLKLIQLTRDYLSLMSLKRLNDSDKYLVNMINLLTRLEAPWLYFEQDVLLRQLKSDEETRLVDEHRKLVNELAEKYRSFIQLKQDFTQVFKTGDDSIKLGKLWSKLISQFMILLQTYTKLILNLTSCVSSLKLDDRSDEFIQLKCQLNSGLRALETGQAKLNEAFSITNKEQCVNLIVNSLENKNVTQTIRLFDLAQKKFFSNELDLDDLVVLACEQSKSQNFIALINTLDDFNQLTEQIMIDNIEIANILNSIERKLLKRGETGGAAGVGGTIASSNSSAVISSTPATATTSTNTQQNEEIDC